MKLNFNGKFQPKNEASLSMFPSPHLWIRLKDVPWTQSSWGEQDSRNRCFFFKQTIACSEVKFLWLDKFFRADQSIRDKNRKKCVMTNSAHRR